MPALPLEIQRHILAECDMATLVLCRDVCGQFNQWAQAMQQHERDAIVRYYLLDNADDFMAELRQAGAVITGPAALAFILRDHTLIDQDLDIAVSYPAAPDIHKYFTTTLNAPRVCGVHASTGWEPHEAVYRLGKKRFVRLITSALDAPHDSPLEAVVHYRNTALMNYFDGDSFGCAYPVLTLRRRAIVSPWDELRRSDGLEGYRLIHLHRLGGFIFSTVPAPFFGSKATVFKHKTAEVLLYDCYERYLVCPDQTRYFGDAGSLIGFFIDNNEEAVRALRDAGHAPLGNQVLWRLRWCPYTCRRGCILKGVVGCTGGIQTSVGRPGEFGDVIYGANFIGAIELANGLQEVDVHDQVRAPRPPRAERRKQATNPVYYAPYFPPGTCKLDFHVYY